MRYTLCNSWRFDVDLRRLAFSGHVAPLERLEQKVPAHVVDGFPKERGDRSIHSLSGLLAGRSGSRTMSLQRRFAGGRTAMHSLARL